MIMIHPTIETLRRLRLTGMAKALEEQQDLPDCDRLSFDERLAMLVDREAVERDNAALAQRLRLARLRQAACLEDLDYRTPRGLDRSLMQTLASGQWLHEHHNILILGPTGIGKSLVACALGNQAARDGFSVRYQRLPGCSTNSPWPASTQGRQAARPARQDPSAHPRRLGHGQAHRRAASRPDGGHR